MEAGSSPRKRDFVLDLTADDGDEAAGVVAAPPKLVDLTADDDEKADGDGDASHNEEAVDSALAQVLRGSWTDVGAVSLLNRALASRYGAHAIDAQIAALVDVKRRPRTAKKMREERHDNSPSIPAEAEVTRDGRSPRPPSA